jgi:hypothetical protein
MRKVLYGSTPDVVYTGYTPGYLATVVASGPSVVFGTGYAYPGGRSGGVPGFAGGVHGGGSFHGGGGAHGGGGHR